MHAGMLVSLELHLMVNVVCACKICMLTADFHVVLHFNFFGHATTQLPMCSPWQALGSEPNIILLENS